MSTLDILNELLEQEIIFELLDSELNIETNPVGFTLVSDRYDPIIMNDATGMYPQEKQIKLNINDNSEIGTDSDSTI